MLSKTTSIKGTVSPRNGAGNQRIFLHAVPEATRSLIAMREELAHRMGRPNKTISGGIISRVLFWRRYQKTSPPAATIHLGRPLLNGSSSQPGSPQRETRLP